MTIIFVALTIDVRSEIDGDGGHQYPLSRDVCMRVNTKTLLISSSVFVPLYPIVMTISYGPISEFKRT